MNMNYLASVAFGCAAYALMFAYGVVHGNIFAQEMVTLSACSAWVSTYAGYVYDNVNDANPSRGEAIRALVAFSSSLVSMVLALLFFASAVLS